jgi:gas vesicle protein
VYDLLTGEKDLKIKESPVKGVYVDGLSEVYVDSKEQFLELISIAQDQKFVSATKLNNNSSRSHCIFILEVTQLLQTKNIQKKGSLYLVDLAGSEKVSKTGAVGETLEEAKKINLSLSALGNVINAITSNSDHIPFRDSKLTRILRESLGGNYMTSFIINCSPHSSHYEESVSSLKFAQRVKTIRNKVKMNIKLTYDQLQKTINTLKNELFQAKKEISNLKNVSNDEEKRISDLNADTININEEYDMNVPFSKNTTDRFAVNMDTFEKMHSTEIKIFCPRCSAPESKDNGKDLIKLSTEIKEILQKVEFKDESVCSSEKETFKSSFSQIESKFKDFEEVIMNKEKHIQDLLIKLEQKDDEIKKITV